MGIGQAITMPLFFASNALYPIALMPGWLQVISHVNPLSYEVDALRGLLIGTPSHLAARLRRARRRGRGRNHCGVGPVGAAGALNAHPRVRRQRQRRPGRAVAVGTARYCGAGWVPADRRASAAPLA